MHPLVPGDSAPPPAPVFTRESRLMLIAPHPDDESLACGVMLQAAVGAGAAIRVVYATDGDNNPWPQRFIERKWRIRQADRLRWGKLRQREAEAALITLGLRAEDARFLGLPDQGLTDLLLRDHASLVSMFGELIEDFAPTDILFPAIADAHPDHNALAVMLVLILRQLAPETAPDSAWQFAVHGRNPAFFANATPIRATRSEIATKVRAIECHQTQLHLSRKRFLRYAERPEQFMATNGAVLPAPEASLQIMARDARQLVLCLPPQKKLFPKELRLLVIGHSAQGKLATAMVRLTRKATKAQMVDGVTGKRGPTVRLAGDHLSGLKITLPTGNVFSPNHSIFLKMSRRSINFADAGWCEVPAADAPVVPANAGHREPTLQASLQSA